MKQEGDELRCAQLSSQSNFFRPDGALWEQKPCGNSSSHKLCGNSCFQKHCKKRSFTTFVGKNVPTTLMGTIALKCLSFPTNLVGTAVPRNFPEQLFPQINCEHQPSQKFLLTVVPTNIVGTTVPIMFPQTLWE